MVNRPFKDIRPVGPIVDLDESDISEGEVEFESMDDLPDSPMLERYINRMSEKTGKPKKEVMNSRPAKEYMRQLGVLDQ